RAWQVRTKLFEDTFLSLSPATQVENGHPACSQYERCELVRLTQTAVSEGFDYRDQNILRQILRSVHISQVPQAVETDARSHPATLSPLGLAFTRPDSTDYVRIA